MYRINPKMEQFWNWNDCAVFRICHFVETLVAVVAFLATVAIAHIRICSFEFDFTFESKALMSSCEYKIQLIAKINRFYSNIVWWDASSDFWCKSNFFLSFSAVCFPFGNVLPIHPNMETYRCQKQPIGQFNLFVYINLHNYRLAQLESAREKISYCFRNWCFLVCINNREKITLWLIETNKSTNIVETIKC